MNNKRSNPIVMAIVVISIIIVYIISGFVVSKREAEREAQRIEAERLAEEARRLEEEEAARKRAEEEAAALVAQEEAERKAIEEAEKAFWEGISPDTFEDSLFIGDSRTDGIRLFGNIEDAVFFADPGSDIYSIKEEKLDVEGFGHTTVGGILDKRQFRKIYVMLGYNEIGYEISKTLEKNAEFIKYLQEKQPNAIIIYQANLHITKKKCNDLANNLLLDELNLGFRGFADGKRVFYIDANPLFDDGSGNLNPEMTSDGAHLYARHYDMWCDWIREETTKIVNRT